MKERRILYSAPMVRAILDGRKTMTRRVVKPQPQAIVPFIGVDNKPTHVFGSCLTHYGVISKHVRCPYGQPGDRLWVRETFYAWGRWETRFSAKKGRDEWHFIDMAKESGNDYLYAANGVSDTQAFIKRRSTIEPMYWKRPSIFMPRAASRITLEVTGVRVQRVQAISDDDAIAEGLYRIEIGSGYLDRYSATPTTWAEAVEGTGNADGIPALAFRDLWDSINAKRGFGWATNPLVWVVEFKRLGQGATA
jgi:hypothetical protein